LQKAVRALSSLRFRQNAAMPMRAAYLVSALALSVGILAPVAAEAGKPQQTKQKPAAPAARGDLLQLGLYGSRGEAEWAWLSLHRKNSALTDKLSALIDPGPNGAGKLLRAFVKDPRNDGEALCREAAKAGQTCFVARKAGAPAGEAPPRPAVVGFIPLPTVKPPVPGATSVAAPAATTASVPAAAPSSAATVATAAPQIVASPPATAAAPVALSTAPAGSPATVTVVSPPVASPSAVAVPPQPLPAAPDALLAARTLDGFIRYSTDDAKVLAEIERRTRRRGRIGAVLPGGGLEVTPAILTQPEFNICALTFDDGPHRTVTRRILDILNEHKVVSTYFPVGNVAQRYPEIIRDFVASGHEIGNHSFTHNDMRPMKIETLRYEVAETNKVLRSLGGSSTLFRPPYGRYSQDLLQVVKEENSQAVLWNVDTRDWKVRDPDKIVEHVTTAAGSGSVLLLHSTYPTTADALPRVISTLREKNCEFVTLSDWIARMQAAGELPVTNAALPGPAVGGRMRN
jgi:peptidoglycan-N-acetylglucosamine deacetylase